MAMKVLEGDVFHCNVLHRLLSLLSKATPCTNEQTARNDAQFSSQELELEEIFATTRLHLHTAGPAGKAAGESLVERVKVFCGVLLLLLEPVEGDGTPDTEDDAARAVRVAGLCGRAVQLLPASVLELLRQENNVELAADLMEASTRLEPCHWRNWLALGTRYYELGMGKLCRETLHYGMSATGRRKEFLRSIAQTYNGQEEAKGGDIVRPMDSINGPASLNLRLKLAQEAVDLDRNDGDSLLILGTSHLMMYVMVLTAPHIDKAHQAFTEAATFEYNDCDDMFHFNWYQVLVEIGHYGLAHTALCKCTEIDAGNGARRLQRDSLATWLARASECSLREKCQHTLHTKVARLKEEVTVDTGFPARMQAVSALAVDSRNATSQVMVMVCYPIVGLAPRDMSCSAIVVDAEGTVFALVLQNVRSEEFYWAENDILVLNKPVHARINVPPVIGSNTFTCLTVSCPWDLLINAEPILPYLIQLSHAEAGPYAAAADERDDRVPSPFRDWTDCP